MYFLSKKFVYIKNILYLCAAKDYIHHKTK